MKNLITVLIILLLVGNSFASPGTTGKLYGQITSKADDSPMPAASINLKGTNFGAASDREGNYFIINIPPGTYTVEARRLGYKPVIVENVKIEVDKSSKVNIALELSDKYELNEKAEQFYSQNLSDEQLKKLQVLKQENKLKYQEVLLKTFYSQTGEKSSNIENLTNDILKLTQMIDQKSKEYKQESNTEKKKKIEDEIFDLLNKRYTVTEKKMEAQIENLVSNINELKEKLTQFRSEKKRIIKGQLDAFLK